MGVAYDALWSSARLINIQQKNWPTSRSTVFARDSMKTEIVKFNKLFLSPIDHYIETELSDKTEWRAQSTRIIHADFLRRWVRPFWGTTNIRDVRTVAVESWLRQLRRKDCGRALSQRNQSTDSQCHERHIQSRDSLRMARTRKESNQACKTKHKPNGNA